MKNRKAADSRVKAEIFPISIFLIAFVACGMFTTLQMKILEDYIDHTQVGYSLQFRILMVWVAAAAGFTLMTAHAVRKHYQQPIEDFAQATRQVAAGDFSVYLAPRHTADRADYLDVIFLDFNKMVEQLGSIETLKTDFFSNVSHEIKTPLAVIQSSAELLTRDTLPLQERDKAVEDILHATKRLSGLITNMLKLNKLEKQAIHPVPEQYDLCAQLCECTLQFEEVWEKKGIEFEAELEDRALIEADPGLLELVWTNLLSNAVKFTPAGGTVRIRQTSDAQSVTVSVTDTGCGMDKATQYRIFEKFYQGDPSHAAEGNGLGLALVQRILQLSEGTIAVHSAPGEGSVFTLRLPRTLYGEESV